MADPKQDGQPVLPTRGFMRQVKRQVDGYGGGPPRGDVRSPNQSWNPGIQRAVVTTAIPTGSVASPSSSGRITIKYKNASGAWVDGLTAQTVYNDNTLAASLPTGRACKVAWIAGDWWLVSASCS